MAFRTGMADVETRLRRLVDDSGTAIWTQQQLQDILDEHKARVYREQLVSEQTLTSGTTYEYKEYHSRHVNYEAGGTAYFQIEDGSGTQRGTADYTADYISGRVTMAADQEGTVLYLSGWSYDLDGAASDCWRERAARVSSYYDVQADGHRMSRSQWFAHCQETADMYAQRARVSIVRPWSSGVFEHD